MGAFTLFVAAMIARKVAMEPSTAGRLRSPPGPVRASVSWSGASASIALTTGVHASTACGIMRFSLNRSVYRSGIAIPRTASLVEPSERLSSDDRRELVFAGTSDDVLRATAAATVVTDDSHCLELLDQPCL